MLYIIQILLNIDLEQRNSRLSGLNSMPYLNDLTMFVKLRSMTNSVTRFKHSLTRVIAVVFKNYLTRAEINSKPTSNWINIITNSSYNICVLITTCWFMSIKLDCIKCSKCIVYLNTRRPRRQAAGIEHAPRLAWRLALPPLRPREPAGDARPPNRALLSGALSGLSPRYFLELHFWYFLLMIGLFFIIPLRLCVILKTF